MSRFKKLKKNNFFDQQKAFGEWANLLEPPITFAESLNRIIITSDTPSGFLKDLEEFELTAEVRIIQ